MTETIDDQVQATMRKEKDEFDNVFDEIEGNDPEFSKALNDDSAIAKDDTKGSALKPEEDEDHNSSAGKTPDTKDTDQSSQEGNKDGDSEKQTTDGIDTSLFDGLKDQTSEDQQTDDQSATDNTPDLETLKAENVQLKADLEKERHKTSSWGGRISKANERAKELEEQNKELLSRIEALESGDGPAKDDDSDDGSDDSQAVTEFFDTFPEFEKPLKALLKQAGKGVTLDEVMDAVKPEIETAKEQTKKESDQDKFMNALRVQHPDVDNLIESGVVVEWIKKQPYYIAAELQRIYTEGGSLQESVNLLNEFKRTSGYKSNKDESTNDTQKNDKLSSMLEVESDGSGPPAAAPDKQDFDAAADEAFAEE